MWGSGRTYWLSLESVWLEGDTKWRDMPSLCHVLGAANQTLCGRKGEVIKAFRIGVSTLACPSPDLIDCFHGWPRTPSSLTALWQSDFDTETWVSLTKLHLCAT